MVIVWHAACIVNNLPPLAFWAWWNTVASALIATSEVDSKKAHMKVDMGGSQLIWPVLGHA
jgi:hypothetical protein